MNEVVVAVNNEVALDAALDVAAATETVEVSAGRAFVETTRAYVSSGVSTEAIETLPLNGKNFEDRITRNLGVSVTYVHRRSRDLLTRRITNLYDVAPGDPNFGQTTDADPASAR